MSRKSKRAAVAAAAAAKAPIAHQAAAGPLRVATRDGVVTTDTSKPTQDSFANFTARLGTKQDNLSADSSYDFNPITRNRTLLEYMYRGSWMVGQVVDCVAEDMTREGIEIISDMVPEEIDAMTQHIQHLQIWNALNDTIKWSRLYGGAVGYIMIEGQDASTPLRLETIGEGQFKGVVVYDRWMLQPSLSNDELVTDLGPDLGMPKFYQVISIPTNTVAHNIHYSRVVRFDGVDLPYNQRIAENWWGMSVVERLFDRLIAFDSTTQGAAQLIYKAHLRTYSVENLREIVAVGGKALEGLVATLDMIRRTQSTEGMTLMDSRDSFETHQYTFAGLSDMMIQFGQQLSGAVGIPLVRLFGQSPSGLNSTGESDLRNYYDNIKKDQERRMRRPLVKILRIASMSLLRKDLPRGFTFKFRPLWQLQEGEKAEIAGSVTTTVTSAYGTGLISERTFLKELRQSSRVTGIWTNITDEDIQAASDRPPPPMVEDPNAAPGGAAEGGEQQQQQDDGPPQSIE